MRLGVLAALAMALALVVGCGGNDGEDLASEAELVVCLSGRGLTVEASDLHSFALTKISPDLATHSDDETAWVILEGSEHEASRTGAELKRAEERLSAYAGDSPGASQTVIVIKGSSVVVFRVEPSEDFRHQVEDCVG